MEHRGTRFGSLAHYEKGGVEVINDDARNYVFSNLFEVALRSSSPIGCGDGSAARPVAENRRALTAATTAASERRNRIHTLLLTPTTHLHGHTASWEIVARPKSELSE